MQSGKQMTLNNLSFHQTVAVKEVGKTIDLLKNLDAYLPILNLPKPRIRK